MHTVLIKHHYPAHAIVRLFFTPVGKAEKNRNRLYEAVCMCVRVPLVLLRGLR